MVIVKFGVINPIKEYSRKCSYNKPWLKDTIERDILIYKKHIDVDFPFDAMYNLWLEQWSWGIHHSICGFIPLFALYGIGPHNFGWAA